MRDEESHDGYEQRLEEYESQLADYLRQRIKPGLSRSAIPLMARSIAKDIARREPPERGEPHQGGDVSEFEAEMRELQAELGEQWVLRFSVHGHDGWLTAETQDGSQRVEAQDAQGLVPIVEAINEGGGWRR